MDGPSVNLKFYEKLTYEKSDSGKPALNRLWKLLFAYCQQCFLKGSRTIWLKFKQNTYF